MVLDGCRIDSEMAADFANRRRKSVGFRVFINEVENRLLAFGEHVMTYTEQVFGSQARISNCFSAAMIANSNQGAALILAVMILSLLSILGSALLTSTTIDIWIGDNYKTRTQALYLAEAGVEQAREELLQSA